MLKSEVWAAKASQVCLNESQSQILLVMQKSNAKTITTVCKGIICARYATIAGYNTDNYVLLKEDQSESTPLLSLSNIFSYSLRSFSFIEARLRSSSLRLLSSSNISEAGLSPSNPPELVLPSPPPDVDVEEDCHSSRALSCLIRSHAESLESFAPRSSSNPVLRPDGVGGTAAIWNEENECQLESR